MTRYSSAASRPLPAAMMSTAPGDNGTSSIRRVQRCTASSPERHPQRIARRQLILAVGRHDQDRELADPTGQEPQQIQRRLIGPVDVLDDDHAQPGRLAELAKKRGKQLIPGRLRPVQASQLPAKLTSDIKERSQRARREQPVTLPPAPARITQADSELLQQRRLAYPGLPGHEHYPALALPGLTGVLRQQSQR